MTAPLHPTPTRLSLLAAIAAGRVTGQAKQWRVDEHWVVTARVREMQAAGWVAPGSPPGAATGVIGRPVLTPAGRAVVSGGGWCGRCGTLLPVVDGRQQAAGWECACGQRIHVDDPTSAVVVLDIRIRPILRVIRHDGCAWLALAGRPDVVDAWTLAEDDDEDDVLDEASLRADAAGWVVTGHRQDRPDVWVLEGAERIGVTPVTSTLTGPVTAGQLAAAGLPWAAALADGVVEP